MDDLVMAFSPENTHSQVAKEKIVFSCSALAVLRSGEDMSIKFDDRELDSLEEIMNHSIAKLLKLPKFSPMRRSRGSLSCRCTPARPREV